MRGDYKNRGLGQVDYWSTSNTNLGLDIVATAGSRGLIGMLVSLTLFKFVCHNGGLVVSSPLEAIHPVLTQGRKYYILAPLTGGRIGNVERLVKSYHKRKFQQAGGKVAHLQYGFFLVKRCSRGTVVPKSLRNQRRIPLPHGQYSHERSKNRDSAYVRPSQGL